MDGYELATGAAPHVPTIALTGYGQETDRARRTAAGFAAHRIKPFRIDDLQR
jgi:CheY-like chemotaxis protein